MNNKTKNLIAFAFTAFVFVIASNASAAVTADDYGTPDYYYNNSAYQNNYYNQNYQPQAKYVAPANNQSASNSVNTSNNTKNVVASNTSTKTTTQSKSNEVAGTQTGVVNASDVNQEQSNNLPALSMRGNNTFMPDTVFEWLLTIIFILAIVIIIRLMAKKHGHGDHH